MSIFNKVGNGLIVNVEGTEFDQGKQQGAAASHLIKSNIVRYRKELKQYRVGEAEYTALIRRNLQFLERTEPALVEELRGLAEGADIPFEDILLINIPLYFILHWVPQECSSILARGKATFDGKTYLLKNRDYGGDRVEHIILNRRYPSGEKIVEVNGAGILTFPGNGLNSHGLAISTSGVWSKQMKFDLDQVDSAHSLLNAHLILRSSCTVDEAVGYLREVPRMSGMNFVIADREKAAAVEVTQDGVYVLEEGNDIIVRTNHYHHPDIVHWNSSPEKADSSFSRYQRATSFLEERRGNIKFQDIWEIGSDQENGPNNSLSRHAVNGQGADTIYTSVIVLEDSQVWTAIANPSEALRVTYA
ncbi:C45 family peptidase [Paenibacillus macerans]|uniref:C45 family peptidase n=1 Tax=Paenibacillus macerans TaxID=44252 RepID=UPI002E1E62B1|nr:C45 family autoproteolytic acyltransferase/hydrolase [Paenibacillus macerans]